MRIVVACILIAYFFNKCTTSEDSNCAITIDELLFRNANLVFGTDVKNGKILQFRDKGKDSVVAGYYSFYNNGHLKSYQFFSDMESYTYNEEYDTVGHLKTTEGKPLIYTSVKRVDGDSLVIRTYFFSMNKEYDTLHVRISNNKVFELKLANDTLFSNTKAISFGINFKGLKEIEAYFKIGYRSICTNKNEVLKDTIRLKYSKQLDKIRKG